MGVGVSFYIRNLVAQDIRQRVSSAKRHGESLVVPTSAAEIADDYPGAALVDDDLRNRLFAEAAWAGVPVELGKNFSKPH